MHKISRQMRQFHLERAIRAISEPASVTTSRALQASRRQQKGA
jgi:hypothetical protein